MTRMKSDPIISVTLVLYNTSDFIRDCLESIRQDVASGLAEIIVVDNASPDCSAAIVREEFPEARLIRSEINRGFAGGCNLAWPHVRGKYWLLLNPDTKLPDGALLRLVEWMEARPEIGMGSPRIVQADGAPVYLSLAFPSLLRALLETSRLHKLAPRAFRSRLLHIPELSSEEFVYVDWAPGTALIARREVVDAVGLLSEEYFMYGEDVEWCWRACRAGWKVGVYRGCSVIHLGGGSVGRSEMKEKLAQRAAQNCFVVDSLIVGKWRARLIVGIRILNCLIEWAHPLRSSEHRAASRANLQMNWNVFIGRDWGSAQQ